jgi:hypothetical protein
MSRGRGSLALKYSKDAKPGSSGDQQENGNDSPALHEVTSIYAIL